MTGGFVRLAAALAVVVAAASQANGVGIKDIVLCEYNVDEATGLSGPCVFEGYVTLNAEKKSQNFMDLDPIPFSTADELNNVYTGVLEQFKRILQNGQEGKRGLLGEVLSVYAKLVDLPTIRLVVNYRMSPSESDGLKVGDPLGSHFRAVFPDKTGEARKKLGATRKKKVGNNKDRRIKEVKPKEIINGKVQKPEEEETEEDEENTDFKKAAAHSSGGAYAQPYPYPEDMSDPYPFPANWASWGSSQSWSNWPSNGGGSSGGYGGGHGGGYENDHYYDDDDDDDGRKTIKVIIVILVILVQIGLIILIAVCIKHYCCSDKKSAATAPAGLEAPQGTRTAVVTPIHIIHGAPMASPMVMHRAMSTPVPPTALALEVPGPANYQAPSPQQLRRATSLTAIIA